MNTPTYDLLTEPWIPVLRADGSAAQVGLREALLQAHEIQGLTGETPLVVAALYRLLLAVLYRALGAPVDVYDWEEIWRQKRFPAEALEAYLERWHARFDLFHPEHPFLQWPDERVRPKSVSALVPHMASGNNATLFDHHHAGEEVWLTPAEAARALLVALGFGLAGLSGLKQKFTDAPWARGAIFLAEGNSLFETLMFNYLPAHRFWGAGSSSDGDRPFWEAENPFAPARKVPLGITDYLTWPNRAILLKSEATPQGWRVAQATIAPGLPLDARILDPYKHYRKDEKRGYLVLRFQEGRALWRDSAALFQLQTPGLRPPRPLDWLSYLVEEGLLLPQARYRFMALGMATDKRAKAKINFYREEHLPLPLDYLADPDLVHGLAVALELAEVAHRVLGQSLSRLATLLLSPTADDPDGRKPDRKDVSNLTAHWGGRRFYWSALETPFWELLLALPGQGEKALDAWRDTVYRTACRAFERVAASLGETPRVLKAVARAERQLLGALFCVFHPQEEKCQRKKKRS